MTFLSRNLKKVVKKWLKIALFWPFLTIFEIPTPIFPKKLDFFGFFGKNPKISVKLALNYPIKTIITQKHQNYHLWVPKWHFWDLRRAKFQYGVTVGGSPIGRVTGITPRICIVYFLIIIAKVRQA